MQPGVSWCSRCPVRGNAAEQDALGGAGKDALPGRQCRAVPRRAAPRPGRFTWRLPRGAERSGAERGGRTKPGSQRGGREKGKAAAAGSGAGEAGSGGCATLAPGAAGWLRCPGGGTPGGGRAVPCRATRGQPCGAWAALCAAGERRGVAPARLGGLQPAGDGRRPLMRPLPLPVGPKVVWEGSGAVTARSS